MKKWLVVLSCLILLVGCAGTSTSKRPTQPIKTLAAKRAQNNSSLLGGIGKVGQASAQGVGWLVGELLRPVESLRKGLVNLFGVTTEEPIAHEKNLPPSPR